MAKKETVKVYAPNPAASGRSVSGVTFADGVAEVEEDNSAALGYFRRHGYGIGERPKVTDATSEPPDPRRSPRGGSPVGTRLRDAAVDPEKRDHLPPVNAGQENPHGPKVVSPQVHAAEPPRMPGGPVEASKEVAQAATELTPDGGEQPAGNASRDAWHAYAVSQGATEGDLADLNRNEIRDRYRN